jgi:hypothetical protein
MDRGHLNAIMSIDLAEATLAEPRNFIGEMKQNFIIYGGNSLNASFNHLLSVILNVLTVTN